MKATIIGSSSRRIGHFDLPLWDAAKRVDDGKFSGWTMLSVFAELPRYCARLGVRSRSWTQQARTSRGVQIIHLQSPP
jgi:hypothetical protein